jgi:hypothetical protein
MWKREECHIWISTINNTTWYIRLIMRDKDPISDDDNDLLLISLISVTYKLDSHNFGDDNIWFICILYFFGTGWEIAGIHKIQENYTRHSAIKFAFFPSKMPYLWSFKNVTQLEVGWPIHTLFWRRTSGFCFHSSCYFLFPSSYMLFLTFWLFLLGIL